MSKLLGDYVLLEGDFNRTVVNGVTIAKNADQGDFSLGEVVEVGTGRRDDGTYVDMEVKVGDKVLFQYGNKVKIDDRSLILVNGSDIKRIM